MNTLYTHSAVSLVALTDWLTAADVLGISPESQPSVEFKEKGPKTENTSSEQQHCGEKHFIDDRGQRSDSLETTERQQGHKNHGV